MTDREKLIELLEGAESAIYWDSSDKYFIEKIADYLIANGDRLETKHATSNTSEQFASDNNVGDKLTPVADKLSATATGWISVTERLPDLFEDCFVVVKMKYDWEKDYEYNVDAGRYVEQGGYIDGFDTFNDWDEGQQYIHVTHWMPLPEPPKEESE